MLEGGCRPLLRPGAKWLAAWVRPACARLPRPPGLRRLGTDWARSFVMVRSAELSLQGVPATRRSNESATSRSTTRFVPELPPRVWSHRPRAARFGPLELNLTTAAAGAMLTRVSDERLMCWHLAETSLRPPIVGLRHLSSLNVPALGPRPKEKRAPLRSRKGVVLGINPTRDHKPKGVRRWHFGM